MSSSEKDQILFKISMFKTKFEHVDVPSDDILSQMALTELKSCYKTLLTKANEKYEGIFEEINEKLFELLKVNFEKEDHRKNLFDKKDIDPNLTIYNLMKLVPEQQFYELGGKFNIGIPIESMSLNKINNIIYLLNKYLLTLIHGDGHETIGDVESSGQYSKYIEIKHICMKYIYMQCCPEENKTYLVNIFPEIVNHKQVVLFRQFITDNVSSDLCMCPIL